MKDSSELRNPQRSTTRPLADGHSLNDQLAFDNLAIVGGGASGLAIFTQMIERAKQGLNVHSITIVEKSKRIGPGLAYSEACRGAILNMPADSMGLSTNNPLHFSEWVAATYPGHTKAVFPQRIQYGEYLSQLMISAIKEAEQLGVLLRVINDEVLDMYQIDQGLELVLANGAKLRAHNVVLAIGNFPGATHRELAGTPGYMQCPWPNSRLRDIPPEASVSILGSRLTAVDTAIFLAENGHRGSINFVSRSARLPKVQGKNLPFARRYVLQSLARDVEESADGAFIKVVQGIQREIESTMAVDWNKVATDPEPLPELISDIANAESGATPWQAILKSTASFVERYWNSFSLEEKKTFFKYFLRPWATYRAPMPLENAYKILALMESGQLQVLQGERVRWNGSKFVISVEGTEVQSQFLIEATGQEFNPYRIDSPLLQRLLSSGLLKSHPAGGVEVDFSTLAATKGLHIIGEMTRGVHFFTNSIDRNIAHAVRIADHLTGEPVRRPLHVALFVGDDLFSNLMLSKLVPHLIMQGHFPFVFLPVRKIGMKSRSFDLRELSFFERELLQDYVIPFLGSSFPQGAAALTVEQMKSSYGVLVERVHDVNDVSFVQLLRSHHIDVGISLGSHQHFQKDTIQYFNSPRVLLNLHRGVLPSYKGVMTGLRAMMNREPDFGYSLHHVSKDSNSGDIVDIHTHPIDYREPVLHWAKLNYETGVAMIQGVIDQIARQKSVPALPQDSTTSRRYQLPTNEELAVARRGGIRLVDGAAIQDVLVRSYAPSGGEDALRGVIQKATNDWYKIAKAPKATNDWYENEGAQFLARL
ncbi:MAG: hypothetical protein MMC33_009224 [Icmadophila ericetorum]|nr:hypothetical protein [Icmadophila ericetorum]